jgi:hypothetical protein
MCKSTSRDGKAMLNPTWILASYSGVCQEEMNDNLQQ